MKTKKDKKPKKFVEELPVKLTAQEYETHAELLAKQILAVEVLETQKKAAMQDFGERILLAKREQETLRKAIETHSVMKQVECIEEIHFEQNRATVVRQDTGEKVRERAITGDERDQLAQVDLLEDESLNGEQKRPRA